MTIGRQQAQRLGFIAYLLLAEDAKAFVAGAALAAKFHTSSSFDLGCAGSLIFEIPLP
jgi:hypothetical protein